MFTILFISYVLLKTKQKSGSGRYLTGPNWARKVRDLDMSTMSMSNMSMSNMFMTAMSISGRRCMAWGGRGRGGGRVGEKVKDGTEECHSWSRTYGRTCEYRVEFCAQNSQLDF